MFLSAEPTINQIEPTITATENQKQSINLTLKIVTPVVIATTQITPIQMATAIIDRAMTAIKPTQITLLRARRTIIAIIPRVVVAMEELQITLEMPTIRVMANTELKLADQETPTMLGLTIQIITMVKATTNPAIAREVATSARRNAAIGSV